MSKATGNQNISRFSTLSTTLLASIFLTSTLFAQTTPQKAPAVGNPPKPTAPAFVRPTPPQPVRVAALPNPALLSSTPHATGNTRATLMYLRRWGVENLFVRATSSGAMIRFSYQIADAQKAKILNDKRVMPTLILERTGQRLEVPTEEKVGQLRQVVEPQNGREYWMVFGNRSHAVKRGDRVDIVVGPFRADGLTVE